MATEERVILNYFTGSPQDIVSDVLRSISAYTREDRARWFKIGITNNPNQRFKNGYAKLYDKMIVLYRSSSLNNVSDLECKLIEHNRDLADNIIGGGGGNYGNPPYYMYVVVKYFRRR
jgi:hypothetical protein